MNFYAIDNHHDTKPWDRTDGGPWRDWACWVPGRPAEPAVDARPATETTPRELLTTR